MATYYLSSLDSSLFAPVRTCRVRKHLVFDTGKSALLAHIDPPVVGQSFGFAHDVSTVVLASRVEGREIDAIEALPFFVHIATPRHGWTDLESPLRADDLVTMAWGELYPTAEAAAAHSFD
ncbi:hypothetical protein GCM10011519_33430 [Marmoricola endophyticus]|uniref:Uncharacterized protein n=1 Tax=Marmoricola endophyticus TaxID=2040280 RepID=A0A917BTG9_9ACTN|nr:hypothetical protein [Marmoricola endophyticus]GGF56824.1 hypothetical protein GCM10011519_33430 [Marmoricola endophyticus]